jgi:hypothetical protein
MFAEEGCVLVLRVDDHWLEDCEGLAHVQER